MNGKLVHGLFPIVNRHGPFAAGIAQGQVKQFGDGFIIGKDGPVLDDFAQTVIERFN